MMFRPGWIAVLGVVGALAPSVISSPAAAADLCGSAFICGMKAPEDLVAVPGSPWVIASSYPRSGKGDLYLIDTRTRRARPLRAAAAISPRPSEEYGCIAPPNPEMFTAHGMSIAPLGRGRSRLLVVNHGAREAIEVFDVDARRTTPSVAWIGCVVTPQGVVPNAVVGLRDGGMLFSTLYDMEDRGWPARIAKLVKGAKTGAIYEWHKNVGFRQISLPTLSGPNGIELSADERYLFISGWADGTLHRIDREGRESPRSITLDFLPDNVRWAPGRLLLVTGQNDTVANMFACNGRPDKPVYCSPKWTSVAIDGNTMAVVSRTEGNGAGAFGDVTVAMAVGDRLWLGSLNGDRVAIVPRQSPTR